MKKIKKDVFWIGKVDWEIRKFHGDEYSTHRGTTYNSYLVKDKKTALIDTVWSPFSAEFVRNLDNQISLKNIDYIVAQHAEIDHSGGLAELMEHIPDTPVYCTNNGMKSFKGHFHKNWNFVPVKTGDKLNLGKKELIFIEAPMLHWPDSMFSYLTEENILFSNDAFGQHLASEMLFNDSVDQAELVQECIKYYANILTPFSGLVEKKIEEFKSLNVPLDMICPSHGVIWRDNPLQIVGKYLDWSKNYRENQITIVYDTMWNGTRNMAEAIAKGVRSVDDEVVVKLFNISHTDKNDVVTEVFKSKTLLVGSPTINKGILSAVAGFMEQIRGLNFKDKRAAAFGTYGWSGESVDMINQGLENAGFELLESGLKSTWNPDEKSLKECVDFGKEIAEKSKYSQHQ
ncbi:MAG: anaerobic nitric oxide reductase flavorubredoxin [Candidatus Aminicenantaceae bacterium]